MYREREIRASPEGVDDALGREPRRGGGGGEDRSPARWEDELLYYSISCYIITCSNIYYVLYL